jgi:hypothetical protein
VRAAVTRAAVLCVWGFAIAGLADARAQSPEQRPPRGADRVPPPLDARPRPGLERLAQAIQRTLQLDDVQAARLREVSARYASRRQALVAAERAARRALREEVARGDGADQARTASAIAGLLDAQRRRLALVEEEQRDLAAFLTPVQRARFLALQERALRAARRARLGRDAEDLGGRRRPPPPG